MFENERKKTTLLTEELRGALGLSTVGYRKFMADGRNYGFSTDRILDESYPMLLNKSSNTYSKEVSECSARGSAIYRRSGKPERYDKLLWGLYKEFDTWNTLAIYQKAEDGCIEGFYFASKRSDHSFIDTYNDFLPCINNSILEIRKSVISEITGEKINVDHFPRINYGKNNRIICEAPKFLLGDIIHFCSPCGEIVSLPFREAQCLVNFVFGRQCKEIAQALQISPRSIETYIHRAMSRFKTQNKSEINRTLIKDPMNFPIACSLFI